MRELDFALPLSITPDFTALENVSTSLLLNSLFAGKWKTQGISEGGLSCSPPSSSAF